MSESKEQREPTRRPWKVYDFSGRVKDYPKTIIVAPTGESICEVSGGWPQCTLAQNEANAELMVRAVNAHESLRQALSDLVCEDCYVRIGNNLETAKPFVGGCKTCKAAREALTLAEKET